MPKRTGKQRFRVTFEVVINLSKLDPEGDLQEEVTREVEQAWDDGSDTYDRSAIDDAVLFEVEPI
jgi:hypothetical protein